MERPIIELNIREPTGLELGTFDIFLIREKVYTGELQHRCQYKDAEGNWLPLTEHPAFAEVLWLIGDTSDEAGRRVSRFGGWSTKKKDSSEEHPESRVRLDGPPRRQAPRPASRAPAGGAAPKESKGGGGLLGRLFGKKK